MAKTIVSMALSHRVTSEPPYFDSTSTMASTASIIESTSRLSTTGSPLLNSFRMLHGADFVGEFLVGAIPLSNPLNRHATAQRWNFCQLRHSWVMGEYGHVLGSSPAIPASQPSSHGCIIRSPLTEARPRVCDGPLL
jgi:hypothetical protein